MMDTPAQSNATAQRTAAADPIVTEIVRNALVGITEEMKTNLMRTAYNMIIYEALDFTVGLFNAAGDTVSIGLGLPMFIRGMSETVKAKLRHFGVDGIEPGDVLLTNDAYTTGSHLNHMTFSVPIFAGDELVGFSACMAHWQDIGGTLGGITTDIYAEGLQMPIVKMYRAGKLNEELLEIIRMNVRIPDRAIGDLRAQIAAVKTGERRFLELIQKYGKEAVLSAIDAIMDHSEALAREQVRAIPDGVYEAEVVHGRRWRRQRPAHPDQGPHHGRGRRDDGRPDRRQRPGARLLQLGHDGRCFRLPGGVQMPDRGARSADQ